MKTPSNPHIPNPDGVAPGLCYDVDPEILHTQAGSAYAACDRAFIGSLDATARVFLSDVITHINPVTHGAPYQHATLFDTIRRYIRGNEDSDSGEDSAAAEDGTAVEALEDGEDRGAAETLEDTPLNDDAGTESESDPAEATQETQDIEATEATEGAEETEEIVVDRASLVDALPGFPRFKLTHTFDTWVHSLAETDDIAALASMRGTTTTKTFAHISAAMIFTQGLPEFRRRCENGEFTSEHITVATQLCRDVPFADLPRIDAYLSTRRADITTETFKKSLSMRIAVLRPPEDQAATAHQRRRVDLTTYPDGSACLTLTGAADELRAFYLRIRAFATAVRSGNTSVFDDQLPGGAIVDDDRTLAALMADIITGTNPQLSIEVITEDTTTGAASTRTIPVDVSRATTSGEIGDVIDAAARAALGEQGISPDGESLTGAEAAAGGGAVTADETAGSGAEAAGAVDQGAGAGDTTAEAPRGEFLGVTDDGRLRWRVDVGLNLTEHGQWAKAQAAMITTVPCTTLLGLSDLPGMFSDGSPIPAEMARRIAGDSRTWMRILTDPATGTPIDAKATSYHIPVPIRRTLIAQWGMCSVPGCISPAENAEIDHIEPFNHDDPEHGGLTVFGNLHPLCKPHHMAKTDRKFDVKMTSDGLVYTFKRGVSFTTAPPDNPINTENARILGLTDPDDDDDPREDPRDDGPRGDDPLDRGPTDGAPPDRGPQNDGPRGDIPPCAQPTTSSAPDSRSAVTSAPPSEGLREPSPHGTSLPKSAAATRQDDLRKPPPDAAMTQTMAEWAKPSPGDPTGQPILPGSNVWEPPRVEPAAPRPGERRTSPTCPEPRGGPSQPGWIAWTGWESPREDEWVWVEGVGPPPF